MEMYSTDWSGKYPTSLSQLTPNYLKTIPDCPTSHEMRYKLVYGPGAGYNTPGFVDYYFVWCDGDVHEKRHGIEKNFPQYDGIHGIIESSSQVEGEPVYIQPAPLPQPKTTKTPEPVATPKGE